MNAGQLSIADVERLLSDPSKDARAAVAVKVARQFANVELAPRERELAHEILGFLVHDVAISVREALARCIDDNPGAPRDVVLKLARDIDQVAIPVLERSPVLTDEDLVGLVYYGSPAKQCAIAGRPDVAAPVSEAIAHRGDRSAVLRLVHNSGAVINEAAATILVKRYADDADVSVPLVQRGELPALLVERLIAMVSEQLREYLVERHEIDHRVAATLEEQTRERTTTDAIARMSEADMRALVAQLSENGRLTATLILRAACAGEFRFVEAAFAQLTAVPDERIWRLIHDVGALGFRAVYARAGMPEALYPAFRRVLDIYQAVRSSDGTLDLELFRFHVLAGLKETFEEVDATDLDSMIDKLARLAVVPGQRRQQVA
ncbi:DUF2336 domain-containing protein [Parvibaculum sp.]|uniref:DUF2336 domain-containing protein n=1 Tax=Parvibaculum sp. TaxID=2024848 RepID=UPI001B075808|nr:DUF2336 domain-containing protein [Parvibaculum sp.]MBO6669585.1 DUF2336 domain-containing protein [Parvibaculum sp.]MBO6691960.1 DUF2336 domain-containing protein [Parvibaculum sp.]MBO6715971.1 DUF2336 domain-containing protein [Parvibaculum sp.]